MTDNNTLYDRTDSVTVGRHTFGVHTSEHHWKGGSGGKMEDIPGNFLEQTVQLNDCENPSVIEQLGVMHTVRLYHQRKETTNEPPGYADLKHKQLVEQVQSSPGQYTQKIRGVVRAAI
jgi:hypothetical protein